MMIKPCGLVHLVASHS